MAVTMICGFPASGKSSLTSKLLGPEVVILNRDTEGGTISQLLPKLESYIKNKTDVILDNLFPTPEIRKPFIELCKKYNTDISCYWVKTSLEDAQFNASQRMIKLAGKILTPEEIKKAKHPNIFPPAVLFKYKKEFQPPQLNEGFTVIKTVDFIREDDPSFTNKAVIVDYDGTLRECVGGNDKFPTQKEHIKIKDNRKEVLQKYLDQGYLLLGVSNQSGVHKGELSYDICDELFKYTNQQIGLDIDYKFCPHQSAPISCYCRKPSVGLGVEFILKYKLNRQQSIFVGDMTTDKTFATRCGFQYMDQSEFFK
jgi:HAD superfamily hydrolase (TIGR01662 family)